MYVFDSFRLDIANATLQRGKQAIVLAPKAFNVLRYLIEHAGQLVTKDDLWQAVWSEVSVTDAALTVCMSEIRKALRDDAKKPRYLETVHRLGYRFIAPVSIEPARVADFEVPAHEFGRIRDLSFPDSHFVGRQAELGELYKWWERALAGERQIVFVTGEPGIGKTTLIEQFLRREQVAHNNGLWLGRGQCIEHYGAGEAYLPLLDMLGRLCRMAGGGRLVELLDEHAPSWLVHMSSLVSAAQRRKLQEKVAGATHVRMLRELAEAMEVITAERPLVLWLEDLHWSDYSTLEWLAFLARRQETARLLVLGTYRPVEVILREHPLKHLKQELQIHRQCQELPLALLSEAAVREYVNLQFVSPSTSNLPSVSREAGRARGPLRKLAHTIYQRTDGNPLFMVNLVDYLAEKSVLKTMDDSVAGHSTEMEGTERIDTPPSIVQMIERNLERLNADEQAVLEAASVAGAEFPIAAVAAALDRSLNEVEACCTRLSRQHQFIQLKGVAEWPDKTVGAAFRFLHELYCEVLYDRMPPGRRIELHHRIAEREENAYGERTSEIAAELAYHYGRANENNRAVKYIHLIAQEAAGRGAAIEAEAQYKTAISLVGGMAPGADRDRLEIALQLGLGMVLCGSRSWSHPETHCAFLKAHQLGKKLVDTEHLATALYGLSVSSLTGGQVKASRQFANEMLSLISENGLQNLLAAAHFRQGATLFWRGELTDAQQHLGLAMKLREESDFGRVTGETRISARIVAANVALQLGYADRARRLWIETLEGLPPRGDPFYTGFVHMYGVVLFSSLCDPQELLKRANELMRLSDENPAFPGIGNFAAARALLVQEEVKEGWSRLRDATAFHQTVGFRLLRTEELEIEAELCLREGRISDALKVSMEVVQEIEEVSLYRPRILMQRANLLSQSGAGAENVQAVYREALQCARNQGNKFDELKVAIHFARWLAKREDLEKARAIISNIYKWFSEGFDTPELKDAKALLDELSQ